MPSGPLQRFRVLDVSRVRSGPTAVRQFADWGAQVIKVEGLDEAGGVGAGMARHGSDFQNLHRNKRSLTLNLTRVPTFAMRCGYEIILPPIGTVDIQCLIH